VAVGDQRQRARDLLIAVAAAPIGPRPSRQFSALAQLVT